MEERMKSFHLVCCVLASLLLIGGVQAADYTLEAYQTKAEEASGEAEMIELMKDFMANAEDIEVLRTVQSSWEQMDPDGALAYARELVEEHPESARHLYLLGRVVQSPPEQVEIGRRVIEMDPDWPYGYRLVTASYATNLFDATKESEETAQLKQMLDADGAHFVTFTEVQPDEPLSWRFLKAYYMHTGDWQGLKEALDKAKEVNPGLASQVEYATCYAGKGDIAQAKQTIQEFVEQMVASGNIPAGDQDKYMNHFYRSALVDARQFDAAIEFVKSSEGFESDKEALYDAACLYSLKGDATTAITHLERAAEAGWDDAWHMSQDPDMEPLRDDPRYAAVVTTVEANWESGADQRKAEALAGKISKPAPGWSLEDAEGNTISLADLQGKVVVLDFWATWCGPCRMAMPMIDEFVEEHAAEDVRVFSVNVWEEQGAKQKEYMQEHDYDMTLLYGTNDLAREYGVQGIPHLCVIDKDGNIRYEAGGVHAGLLENLIWWTNDLL
jgi:thiol-disulfide isomerase/thioredoxin